MSDRGGKDRSGSGAKAKSGRGGKDRFSMGGRAVSSCASASKSLMKPAAHQLGQAILLARVLRRTQGLTILCARQNHVSSHAICAVIRISCADERAHTWLW